jgi:hypothetical protein
MIVLFKYDLFIRTRFDYNSKFVDCLNNNNKSNSNSNEISSTISSRNSSNYFNSNNNNNTTDDNDSNNKLIKPYSCDLCARRFNSKYNVIRHLKQYHADRRMFKCNICGRDYKWIDSLNKHMKLHKNQIKQ